jgi:hypothetical protein
MDADDLRRRVMALMLMLKWWQAHMRRLPIGAQQDDEAIDEMREAIDEILKFLESERLALSDQSILN